MTNTFVNTNKLTVAVVTGRHPHDVPNFHAVFRSIPDIDFYPQHMEDFVFNGMSPRGVKSWKGGGEARSKYDVLVFYNWHQRLPDEEDKQQKWWERDTESTLSALGDTEQGIFVLHHALLAFPNWRLWSDIVGIHDRRCTSHFNQTLRIEVTDPPHPITQNLKSWEMVDETYVMHDAGNDSKILLTTSHPKSLKTIAWTRHYKNARVFCYQSGHDSSTFTDPNFRTVVAQGIRWLAGRI
jgi:trehalose utilization protein